MAEKPVLVVMAAGMGSRYGGLKQIDPVGSCGEAILDYSVFDAKEAGFEKVVIIIKEAIRQDFMDTVGARLQGAGIEIAYAYQELEKLPEGYSVPEGRTKPFGTGHAVLCAKDAIGNAPFAVINADDYYGKEGYRKLYTALTEQKAPDTYCMVGYELGKTVTENGTVSRGVCQTDENGKLVQVVERTRIEPYSGGIHYTEDGENWVDISEKTTVSMNMWGFTEGFLPKLEARFLAFLQEKLPENPVKGEFYLPFAVQELLEEGKVQVDVLTCSDQWHGVTYAADKPAVVAALQEKTAQGLYPDGLWHR